MYSCILKKHSRVSVPSFKSSLPNSNRLTEFKFPSIRASLGDMIHEDHILPPREQILKKDIPSFYFPYEASPPLFGTGEKRILGRKKIGLSGKGVCTLSHKHQD